MAVYHAHMMAAMPEPRVLELNIHQGPLHQPLPSVLQP